MRVKTSITLSEDILKLIDRMTRKGESRSEAIERLLRESLAAQARRVADLKELALINKNADQLNAEVEDVLRYQADL
jgi:metal-responsive CopG/Arc/MetJ family transcriptional regulator